MCRKEFGVMMEDCRLGVRVGLGLGDMGILVRVGGWGWVGGGLAQYLSLSCW